MDAQTIYDKNGAMFTFTKDSYKANISYYNSIGIEFCEHEHFSIKSEIGFIEIGEYFRPTSLNSVNSHINYVILSAFCNYVTTQRQGMTSRQAPNKA